MTNNIQLTALAKPNYPDDKECLLCKSIILDQHVAISIETLPQNILYFDYKCFKMLLAVGLKHSYQDQSTFTGREN